MLRVEPYTEYVVLNVVVVEREVLPYWGVDPMYRTIVANVVVVDLEVERVVE